MKKTIGILAHVDAGKTTFCDQVLYHTKSIKKRGRVDHKDSFLDSHNIEQKRGITIFSDQGIFTYNTSDYYLVDTPGHIDFSPEMERMISIMDYAVVIISAVEGVQSHTETVFRLLKNHKVPTFFFINKVDRIGADINKVIEQIKSNLTIDVCDITSSFKQDYMENNLIEFIAERDEKLFELYIDEKYDYNLWVNSLKNMIKNRLIYPCMTGSALHDIGIEEFIDKLDKLTYTSYSDEGEFLGRVYKIRHDENNNRLTYIKALKGNLKIKDEIKYNGISEKINQIRIYNGNKFNSIDYVSAGELAAVTGLSKLMPGQGIGKLADNQSYEMVSTLKSKVIYDKSMNIKEVLNNLRILDSEEPSLNVIWDEDLQEIHIHVMGKIQLEVLKELAKERFNMDIYFGKCEILYKETIEESTIGYGHFEPLGHYSEVHLKIEPTKRNSGITFESICHVDELTIGNQNLVRTHIFERDINGILTGSPITDIKITLLIGRSHNKHTSGGDFREATYRALRQGIEQVNNVVLEPYYKFKIEVKNEYIGRVLSDIQKLNGSFDAPEVINDRVSVIGRGPVVTFIDYSMELISFTKGNGSINLIFDGYDICNNQEEVIETKGYNKDADEKYTSNSIFCSKGQAYIVKGNDAKKHMHCTFKC